MASAREGSSSRSPSKAETARPLTTTTAALILKEPDEPAGFSVAKIQDEAAAGFSVAKIQDEAAAGFSVAKTQDEAAAGFSAAETQETGVTTGDLPLDWAYKWERLRNREVFLTQPVNGSVKNWTWGEAMSEARRMAAWLEAQGWPHGSHIVILSRNSAWWIMAELAIWMSGHVTVPIYTSLTLASARQLFEHCDPVACFLGALDNAELLPETIAPGLVSIRFPNAAPAEGFEWQKLVDEWRPIRSHPVRLPDEVATIIYTSGTTGAPKGVMHRFGAFPYFAQAVTQVTGTNRRHRVLSYLPLAHIAERALTETAALATGWHIFFSESTATFLTDLKRARPTIFFSVPRLYAKFKGGVLEKIPQRRLGILLKIPILRALVRRRILNQLGLGAVRFAASGSAPLAPDAMLWFRQLGLPLSEGYGTTETGITHTAPKGEGRPGTVGRNAPGVLTRISPEASTGGDPAPPSKRGASADVGGGRESVVLRSSSIGEVQVRSPMNMLGYYKDMAATREAFTPDGFLRTGDLGKQDADGWLTLKGRIKEQFKTSKGKYVSPSTIEHLLSSHSAVECSLVMGSGLPAPFAVIVLSAEAQRTSETESGRAKLSAGLEDLLAQTNAVLAPHERLRFLVLSRSKWTIGNGFLTPTLKLKRAPLEAYYTPYIEQWSAMQSTLVWHSEYNEPR